MKKNRKNPEPGGPNPYPAGFVYGAGEARPGAWSLSGLKIARALRALAGTEGRILELGCGGGQYLRALRRKRPDLELFAVDLDPMAAQTAGKISGLECRVADVASLPYPQGYFSAVLGFDILEHVPDPDRVLKECARVLAQGGRLHFYVPCEGNPGTVYVRRGHALKAKWGGHQQQFTTSDLISRIERVGFKMCDVRHSDYWLTQQFDYAFFKRLDQADRPEDLWAAQALRPGGGVTGWILRWARRLLSTLAWCEGRVRRGARGAMGVHVTAERVAPAARPVGGAGT